MTEKVELGVAQTVKISVRLPADLVERLRERAPNGQISPVIRELLEGNRKAADDGHDELWRMLGIITTILDQLRMAGRYDDEHMEIARTLYESFLNRFVFIPGVEQ